MHRSELGDPDRKLTQKIQKFIRIFLQDQSKEIKRRHDPNEDRAVSLYGLLLFEQVFDLAEDATGLFGSVAGNIAELARYAFHNLVQL